MREDSVNNAWHKYYCLCQALFILFNHSIIVRRLFIKIKVLRYIDLDYKTIS